MRIYLHLLLGIIFTLSATCFAGNDDILAIIVPPEHTTKSISKSDLSLIFWRKKLYWANGKPIRPVNFSIESPLRNQFSKRILGSTPEAQSDYWNGLYFHGISPPYTVNSTEAALRFIAETTGSIAYINACQIDERVKVLAWIDSNGNVLNSAPSIACNE